jgi:hypothetical protein
MGDWIQLVYKPHHCAANCSNNPHWPVTSGTSSPPTQNAAPTAKPPAPLVGLALTPGGCQIGVPWTTLAVINRIEDLPYIDR